MHSFTDAAGRQWHLDINVDTILRVKSLIKVDLQEMIVGDLVHRVSLDALLLTEVVFAICKTSADELKIEQSIFAKAMRGDVIDAARNALFSEMVEFCPKDYRRLLEAAIKGHQTRMAEAVEKELAKLLPPKISGSTSSDSPASAASTPSLTPGVS